MDFTDREREWERLDALAQRPQGGLAVLTGRRRVGKTRLLVEWTRRRKGLYTVADQSAAEIQRRYFVESLSSIFPALKGVVFSEWRSLLRALAREAVLAKWRGPLVMDEVPFLVASSPELPSVLQHWFDHEARGAGLVVALAGSSQRMMQDLVLDEGAPLYGRASEFMTLRPLLAGYIGSAMGLREPESCLSAYGAWGGIPRYWELAEPFGTDLDKAVDRLVLDPLGPLHNEPDRLLREELPSAHALRPLLDAIGLGAHRAGEIAGRIGQPATSLVRPLARLVEMDLAKREIPFGESEKGGKRALYKLSDPFLRLWFKVVGPHRGLLTQAPMSTRIDLWRRHRNTLMAAAWEDLAREIVGAMDTRGHVLGKAGPWLPASRYWLGNGPEWDVVSRSLDGKTLLLGEAKWSERPMTRAAVAGAIAVLMRKGVPALKPPPERVLHALFVPRTHGAISDLNGVAVIDARTILETLR